MKLSELAATLRELGLRPSKALGQNFLHDANLARSLVHALALGPGDHVVEIGPGLGSLTRWVLETGAHLIAIEKDRRLAEWLDEHYTPRGAKILNMDALDFDVRDLFSLGPITLVGNLPYSVSTPLLFHWTQEPSPISRLLLTLQLELAERLTARPHTAAYGELSVVLQRHFKIRLLRKLPPTVFLPEPGVSSGCVLLERHPQGHFAVCNETTFRSLLAAGFGQRRKQVRKAMARLGLDWDALAPHIGAESSARAEELDVHQWVELARLASPVGKAQSGSDEMFAVVDEDDTEIGAASRAVVHEQALRHRSVHILVFNGVGEVWLQRRSHLKDRFPGVWDSSAAGHVDAGESYENAAVREIAEEMGVQIAAEQLQELGKLSASEATGMEFVRVYAARHEGPFRCPPAEVDGGRFFKVEQVERWTAARPQDFAPGFLACWALRPPSAS